MAELTSSNWRRWLPRWRAVRIAAIVLALTWFGWEVAKVTALGNWHTVIPGRLYRCAQPVGDRLPQAIDQYGIRTVVNLRGLCPEDDWYLQEAATCAENKVSLEDVTFSATRLPAPSELRQLIEVFDQSEAPLLIHCKQGADRTGLAATLFKLLYTDATLAEARRQLWPIYGHVRFGRTIAMDDFFDRYEAWLAGQGAEHSPNQFREWALNVYTPGPRMSELELLEPLPTRVKVGEAFAFKVRATNRSGEAWEMKPGDYAGIHLGYMVIVPEPLALVSRGKAGLQRTTVLPGESVELLATVPPIHEPGRYQFAMEMTDARGSGVPIRANSFVQFGDHAVLQEIIVE